MGNGRTKSRESKCERKGVSILGAKSFPKNAGCVRLACQGGGLLRGEWQFSEATLRGTTLTNKIVSQPSDRPLTCSLGGFSSANRMRSQKQGSTGDV